MSSFTGNASGGTAGVESNLRADDIRLWPEWLSHDYRDNLNIDGVWTLDGFANGWWPGAVGMDASGNEWCAPIWWDRPEITRGHSGRLGFTGVVRDVWGTAVAGAVVKLFRTVDDSLQSSTTSATDGTYTLSTPFADAHYMISFLDAAIDTAGATPNTLIPA